MSRARASLARLRAVALAPLLALALGAPALAQEKGDKPKGPPPAVEPPRGVELPIPVKVSGWIHSITKIDEVEGTFTGEIDVWLRWVDPRLAFDPATTGGFDRLEYGFDEAPAKIAQIWTPLASIANLDKGGDEKQALIIEANGHVGLMRKTNGRFKTALEFGRFPFDTQNLTVEIRSPRYGANVVAFSQEPIDRQRSGVNAELLIPNWRMEHSIGFSVGTRRGWTGRDHSVAYMTIRAHRETAQYFFQLFLPFFTIMMFPPLALWVPKAEVMPRANMAFSGLFSLIAFSYSIFVRYPMLAAVDNVMVSLLWLGYVYLALVLLVIMTVLNPAFTSRFPGKHLWAETVDYLTWAIPLLFVLFMAGTMVQSM